MRGVYLDLGEVIAIILMTAAFTAFIMWCGHAWQMHEAKLLIARQDDEIYDLKQGLTELKREPD